MDKNISTYDIIIIGSGAAGLTAGMYAARRGMKTLILSKDFGGQTASTAEIENYPGIGHIEGVDLMQRFLDQTRVFGCEVLFSPVVKIESTDGEFVLSTPSDTFRAISVICAFGKTAKNLGIPREQDFFEKGVCYSTILHPERYTGRRVAVVGGGNSAVQAAAAVSAYAVQVFLIHRRDDFRAEKILMDRLATVPNVEYIRSAVITAVSGGDTLQSITVEGCTGGDERVLDVDLVCVAIGLEMRTEILADLVDRTEGGEVHVTVACETKTPGLFAAGDITNIPYQQIVISAGEGAKAALSASAYVMRRKGIRPIKVDWGYVQT